MSVLSMCRSSCVLLRQTTTKDSSGPGGSASYTQVAGPARCDVQPDGAAVQERFGQFVLLGRWAIYLAVDLGVRASDILQVGSRKFLVIEGGGQGGGFGYPGSWPSVVRCREVIAGP